jgi:hypothetical protein
LLALGPVHALAAFTARPVAAGAVVLPVGTFALSLHFLLALVPLLALLTIGTIAPIAMRAARAASRLSSISGCSCHGRFSGSGRRRGTGLVCGDLRLLRPVRAPRAAGPAFGSSGRTPNLDKQRLLGLGGFAFSCWLCSRDGIRRRCGRVRHSIDRCCFRFWNCFCRSDLVHLHGHLSFRHGCRNFSRNEFRPGQERA